MTVIETEPHRWGWKVLKAMALSRCSQRSIRRSFNSSNVCFSFLSVSARFNLVDDERLSVTFNKVKLVGVDTVTLKEANGKITAEIEYVAN